MSVILEDQKTLNQEQKKAIILLSFGTFLEYFDLMLYIHMAVVLNDLFFPKTDPFTQSLFTAFAFWSTYLLRPFGAMIFGYIGDQIGRKVTVILTTFMMSAACITMVFVKTYDEIGIAASIIVTICRMLQGMSCVGEVSGAELYLTETIKPPLQYPSVTAVTVFSVLGATSALGVSSYVLSHQGNWRIAFMIGAGVALIGIVARAALRETPDFVDAKRKVKLWLESNKSSVENSKIYNSIINQQIDYKTILSYFIIRCAWPASFYFIFVHCGNVYKNSFGLTASEVINQNFVVSIFELISTVVILLVSFKIYPLKILRFNLCVYSIFILISPYLLSLIKTPSQLLCIQIVAAIFGPGIIPASAILYKHFPIFKRFTYTSMLYAISRIIMYGITSFGLIYLIKFFGNYGLLILMIPIIIGYGLGLSHFQNLEVKVGNYPIQSASS